MPKRVLVVDDDDATREVLLDMLALLGYAGRAVADADDLEAVAAAYDPHLIILDVTLPGHQDGLAALVRLREDGMLTPVLLASGQYEAGERGPMAHYTRILGGQEFLKKPLDLDELEARVKALIGPPEA
jgi:DNA-binding response OmpR family regulator